MIPHKLVMKGFGSYLKETVIDFDSVDSIFLIDGSTGAGKSMILDAITYALYGESSGDRTAVSGDRTPMMSKCLRGDKRRMTVDFTFEAAGRMYRFSREEWYTKPRKGDGIGTPQTRAAVFDITGGSEKQINSKDTYTEVNSIAEDILHMTCGQFCQIVVLPQGKIEKLLTGNSKEKGDLFRELFGTERIKRITDTLNKRSAEASAAVKLRQSELEKYYKPDFESIEALRSELVSLEKEHAEDMKAIAEQDSALKKITGRYEELVALSERFRELDRQNGELIRLRNLGDEFAHKKAELELIEAQIRSVSEYTAYKTAEEKLRFRTEETEKAQKLRAAADKGCEAAKAALEGHMRGEEEARAADRKHDELIAKTKLYEKISAAEKEHQAAYSAAKLSKKSAEEASARRKELDSRVSSSEERAEKLRQENENIPEQLIALNDRRAVLEQGRELSAEIAAKKAVREKMLADHSEKCRKCDEADGIMIKLSEEYDAAFEAHIGGLASELARGLKEGEKCPVCGSVHHPEPFAPLNGAYISAKELKDKKDILDRSAKKLSGMKQDRDVLKNDIDRLSEELSEKSGRLKECGYSAEELARVSADIGELKKRSAELSGLDSVISRLRTELRAALDAERAAAEKYNNDKLRLANAGKELEILKQSRAEGIDSIEALNSEIARCREIFTKYESVLEMLKGAFSEAENKAVSAKAQLEAAERELTKSREERTAALQLLEKKLIENGITQKAELFVPDEVGIKSVDALRKQCSDYDAQVRNTAAAVTEISAELEGKERPDIEGLRAEKDALSDRISLAREIAIRREERIKGLRKSSEEYDNAFGECEQERKTASEMEEFANMLGGKNGKQMSFERYVLGVMLDIVLARANVMLEGVLDSNYRMYKQSEGSGNTSYGLDINVINYSIDAAGADYSVRMLSGGEKFVMSVILGLAIAETVQSRTGGIEVNSLFIDEGFGTLDNDALEQILQVLQSCTAGKKIGIISHVESLEMIPTGFEVTKNPAEGSVVRVRTG
ncbi:MAG: AAA family ATPase, partial [Oscillospiraceae bacterium]